MVKNEVKLRIWTEKDIHGNIRLNKDGWQCLIVRGQGGGGGDWYIHVCEHISLSKTRNVCDNQPHGNWGEDGGGGIFYCA